MRSFFLLAILLLAPAANAAPVDLYLHVNGFQDMPITTEPPADHYSETVDAGLTRHSACVEDPLQQQRFTGQQEHTWYGFMALTPVFYDEGEAKPRYSHARGLDMDLHLHTDIAPTLTWYMAASMHEQIPVGAVPKVTVQATLREGTDISVGNVAYNNGPLVGQGTTGPFDIYPGTDAPVSVHQVDGMTVYGFTVPIELEAYEIDNKESFNVRIDAFVEEPLCQEGYLMPDGLKVHTSPGLRPTLGLDVANPITVSTIHPAFTGDDLAIHFTGMSPFGGNDVVVAVNASIPVELRTELDPYPCHSCLPAYTYQVFVANVTSLANGEHSIQLIASNLQGTAHATVNATLIVTGDSARLCFDDGCLATAANDSAAPGFPALGALMGLMGLAFLARRRG